MTSSVTAQTRQGVAASPVTWSATIVARRSKKVHQIGNSFGKYLYKTLTE
jgi:hypothetical protein